MIFSHQWVGAAEEQRWNEAILAEPLTRTVARCWSYAAPAIVLGRSQRARRDALRPDGLAVVDRVAGGGAVLVGPWLLGTSVALSLTDPRVARPVIADATRWLGTVFAEALSAQGIEARSLPHGEVRLAPSNLTWACFAGVSPWEVVVGDRKLVGFAQRRNRNGVLLVAGALLGTVPWRRLTRAFGRPETEADELAAATIDAEALLGRPLGQAEFAASLANCLSCR